ncbi:hypothetical protein, partial [Acidiphilium multivorum]|uniref:hypothetical protein n=1 Tax=Acidiphilium multivorum TaxID=62140 RepID=UPI001B8B5BF0
MKNLLLSSASIALAAILCTYVQASFMPNRLMGMNTTGVTGQLAGTHSGDLISKGNTAPMPSIATPNRLIGMNATGITGQLAGTQSGDLISNG